MRILILTFGSRGDVQPYVALGAALRGRGHAVTVSTGRGFEAMIEAAGLAAAPLSADIRGLLETEEIKAALHSFAGKLRAWRASRAMMRRQLDDMWQVAQAIAPELVVYHPKAFGAPLLAIALDCVAVPGFLQPAYVPTRAFPNLIFPVAGLGALGNRLSHTLAHALMRLGTGLVLRDWRRRRPELAGLGPADPVEGHDPRGPGVLRLHAHSRHLVPPPPDWGARERITGYWFTAPDEAWRPPEALARFLAAGPPPVYVGFGSMPADDAGRITRNVLEALARGGQRGLLATGWGGLAAEPRAEGVLAIEAAPHTWLFPRCAAVVHHGGAGTTHEALRWGRPQVVCPVFGDQPFWGRRIAALGAGPAPLPQKRLTAAALAAALSTAADPAVVARAEALGAELRAEPGVAAAAELLEGVGARAGRRPG
ncbi:MAG: glycosyltransferase [Kiloniellales bacterium]|nr:glycosyltransferase [Kiloniellales bacterium]